MGEGAGVAGYLGSVLDIWGSSGHMDQRARGRHCFVKAHDLKPS